ncbi:MAG TPA: putative Ig domain-containing protein [Streptosporangiaceae bacterium]|nr:putative Ig domain-containing protein [Streptosporangiaceae bacterium]
MALAPALNAMPAAADTATITGTVVDSSNTPQANVAVDVQDPSTSASVASTSTDQYGDFSVTVPTGTYNIDFTPPAGAIVQSYLATGVTTDGVPLYIVLKPIGVIHIQGTLQDSKGNVYTNQQDATVSFTSPQNPGSTLNVDANGSYATDLLADQNFAVTAYMRVANQSDMVFNMPVGTLSQSQTYNVTVPLVPNGVTLYRPTIHLDNGLIISFSLHPITGDRHAYIIFNETTGSVLVDDQPPVVSGTADRSPNANGWYNAPVTITWSSTDPAPSSGTPTTPAPTTVTTEGANQVITSGQSCDPAGNCATGGYTLSLDKTPPSITAVVQPAPNAAGWNNSDPTISYTCLDALSGVELCPGPQTASTDGANQVFPATAVDNASNNTTITTTVNVDTAPPVVSNAAVGQATITDGGSTTLSADVADSLSGVSAAEFYTGTDPGPGNGTAMTVANGTASVMMGSNLAGGSHTLYVRAEDVAGNWSSPVPVTLTVKPQAPTGLAANSPTAAPALTWNPVAGASSYNIYRDGTVIGTATSPSYTDTTASPGPHSYQVTAVAAGLESDRSNSVDVVVGTAPSITSGNSASTGMRVAFDFTITTTGAPTPSLTESGTLPAGITFSDKGDGTADISGIAVAGTAGSYPVTITADNGIGTPATQPFTLTVTTATSAPSVTSDTSDTETFGAAFTFTVTTTGYPAPKLTKTGALPPGVTFTDNGDGTATIAGTPAASAVGNYPLTITAKNSTGTATQAFTLVITKAPVIKKIPNLTAHTGTAFTKTITAVGSPSPALTESGSLPAGLTFTDNGDGTATLAGTPGPSAGGSYPITVTATNSLGTTSQTFTLKVDQPPAITSPSTATASTGSAFSFQITTTGYPAPRLTKLGTLPKGLTFKAGAGTITGTPAAGTAGTYQIAITAKNSSGTTSQTLTITVS